MKSFWIALGAVAAAAGVAYLLKDNEEVKGALDKINQKANDAMGKWSSDWKKANDRFNQMTGIPNP